MSTGFSIAISTDRQSLTVSKLNGAGSPDASWWTNGSIVIPASSFGSEYGWTPSEVITGSPGLRSAAIAQTSDGSALVSFTASGKFVEIYGLTTFSINQAGSISTLYQNKLNSSSGNPFVYVNNIFVETDGSYVILGSGSGYHGSTLGSWDVIARKFSVSGQPVVGWGTGGDSFFTGSAGTSWFNHQPSSDYERILGAVKQVDGKVVVLESYGPAANKFALIRIDLNGQVDSSFGSNGYVEVYQYPSTDTYRPGTLAASGSQLVVQSQNDTFVFDQSVGALLSQNVTPVSSSQSASSSPSEPLPICFTRGTRIQIGDQSKRVEALSISNQISTSSSSVSVKWIGYQRRTLEFAQFQDYLPVKISAGALDDNLPLRDLYLSPDHAVLVDGHLIHAKALVNGKTIVQMTEWEGDIEYYHIETEAHEIIYAEGVPCETFIDNVSREQFDNYAEYQALYPNTRMMKELPLPRVKFKRQLPLAIRQRLESRISKLDRQKKG